MAKESREVCTKLQNRRHCVPSMCVAYEPTPTGRVYDPERYQPIKSEECIYYIEELMACKLCSKTIGKEDAHITFIHKSGAKENFCPVCWLSAKKEVEEE